MYNFQKFISNPGPLKQTLYKKFKQKNCVAQSVMVPGSLNKANEFQT
jgi:hypothetical protein